MKNRHRLFLKICVCCLLVCSGIGIFAQEATSTSIDEKYLTLQQCDTTKDIQIFLPSISIPVGNALQVNQYPALEIRSLSGKTFILKNFVSVTYNQALDSENAQVAYVSALYRLKNESLKKYDALIKGSVLNFQEFVNAIMYADLEIQQNGSTEAPDPKTFKTLKNIISYNFEFVDGDGNTQPLQVLIESKKDSSELN